MSSSQIVLFDIDGTLMRGAGPQHKAALIQAAKSELRVDCTLDDIDTTGCLDPDLLRLMLENAGVDKKRVTAKMSRMLEAAQHHYSVHCKADFSSHLCPGVKATLNMLTEHQIPLGLVTGNLSAIAWRKLENAHIDHFFTFGAFAEQAKTRAALAKLAVRQAQRMNTAAKHCSVTLVGDHANDIEAAKLNGFRSVAVATGLMPAEELRLLQADVFLETLEEATFDAFCAS